GSNGRWSAASSGSADGRARGANCSRARSRLCLQPRVRRLATPRRASPVARASSSCSSSITAIGAPQLQLTAGTAPAAVARRGGIDCASRRLSHSAARFRCRFRTGMARIEYDEDDHDDPRPASARADWRRRLVTAALALAGLGIGFMVPYALYLNGQISERFGELRWQVPTRVYARPLRVAPGLAMDAQTLELELAAAAYREGDGVRPGTYLHDDGRWTTSSRGFRDVDGAVGASRIRATLSGGRVRSLVDPDDDRELKAARLDAARIATLYGQKQEERRLVRVEDVPPLVTDTLQAVEDRDFAHHFGIDISGMARAAWVNLRSGEKKQGASTLTQQLARSGLLGIGREQTWSRKFNEIFYALLMEARYDKATILEAYLNQVYLGQRGAQAIHGVAAGAEFWFGRRLEDLDTEHVALLVGLVRGPSYYDPRRHPERAKARRDFVLANMFETGLVDQAGYERALQAPLG